MATAAVYRIHKLADWVPLFCDEVFVADCSTSVVADLGAYNLQLCRLADYASV